MKKLKVLHYIPGFNTGGIESVFLNWFKNIDSEKIVFELLVRNYDPESPLLKEYLSLGGKLHTLKTPSLGIKTMLEFYQKVNRFFKQHSDYDFLHVHVADDPFIIDAAKKNGIQEVGIHAHTTGYNETYRSQGLKGKIRTHNVKAAQHYLAITQVAADWMFPEDVRAGKDVQIIHNGIDAKAYVYDEKTRERYRHQLHLEGQYAIMHVGRFSEVKNHFFMLDLFEKAKEMIPNSKLIFVGDGPLLTEVTHDIQKRQLTNDVLLLGARGDVAELLQAADVFLLPSKFEGLGLSAIEAQAAGLPTLVSDCVPEEVAITNLVSFIPLKEPLEKWVDVLAQQEATPSRKNTYQAIVDAHYDVSQTVKDLSEYYYHTQRSE